MFQEPIRSENHTDGLFISLHAGTFAFFVLHAVKHCSSGTGSVCGGAPVKNFIVWWIKRDLRVADNEALSAAVKLSHHSGRPLVAVWMSEPDACLAPEFHIRRERFVFECLQDLEPKLGALNVPLILVDGPAEKVVECLVDLGMTHLFSHEETGVLWTFERDTNVKKFCEMRGVDWHEFPTNGVVRRLASRNRWQAHYQGRMQSPLLTTPDRPAYLCSQNVDVICRTQRNGVRFFSWSERAQSEIAMNASRCFLVQQRGGEAVAHKLLHRFLQPNIHSSYVRSLSRPQDSQYFSSRLSPYLAFGCISSRQIITQLNLAKLNTDSNSRSLNAFQSRLAWRCHFIQKLENHPEMEDVEQNSALKNLRPLMSPEEFERWCAGQTGVPLVDACLRSVHQTGFLNFRMRAMLMSFSTHLMWRDWREPSWDLARAFLDFEPGIHFSQVQMQAAVTGNNQIRIYNPLKQSVEHDPDAKFIKNWVPELRSFTAKEIHTLSNLPRNYPSPIVDVDAAMTSARERLFKLFKADAVRSEAKKVQEKLGSRGGPLSWRGRTSQRRKKADKGNENLQPTLFDEYKFSES